MERSKIIGRLKYVGIIGVLWCIAAVQAVAQDSVWSYQTHPDLWVQIDDSVAVYRIDRLGDTTNPLDISQAYTYTMMYDSTSRVDYTITECRKNSARIKLKTWKDGRAVNAHNAVLSFQSATDTFTVYTGDTVRFYRELGWLDPTASGGRDTNNYRALDTLNYTVELVRKSNHQRVARLDSLGALRRTTPGVPVLYGDRPLMAIVKYIVPSSLNGVQVYMRTLLYSNGSGQYWFVRKDNFTIGLSHRVEDVDSVFYPWKELFSGGYPKVAVKDLTDGDHNVTTGAIDVKFLGQSQRNATITFSPAGDGPVAVAIYDVSGTLIFEPYVSPSSQGTGSVQYTFPDNGMYFIALLDGNRIARVKKIVINK
ncbi:MAG: T9SS type A sorting domain-containing protein [Candidatus Kapaibacterium sp.]